MAQQMPPPSPQTPARRKKQARLDQLNMGIAKTHRLATQLVSIQLSGANLLALLVSAASVVAGTVSLVADRYPFNWPLLLSAGVIGLGLALLIEGLTLGSLIRIRLANRAIRGREEHLEHDLREALAALAVPDLAQPHGRQAMRHYRQMRRLLQHEYRQKRQQATRLHRRQRRFSLSLAFMGAMCSAIAGGLFYHTILAGLGPVESLVLAILFPLVVTGTFVSSEIHKDAQEDAIREGFGGGELTETAIRAETKLTSALAVHEQVLAYLEKPEAEQAIEAGAKSLLHDILAELRETSRQVTHRVLITEETDDTTRPLTLAEKASDTTFAPTKQGGDMTSPGVGKAGDAISAPTEKEDDTTSSNTEKAGDTTSLDAGKTGDTTSSGAEKASDTTQHSAFVASLVQERSKNAPQTVQQDQQEHTKRLFPESFQRSEHDRLSQHDTTDVPRVHRKNQGETRQRKAVTQNDAVLHDQTANPKRQQTRRSSKARTPEKEPETTSEQDALTTQILTYLSEHPNAKQMDVAQALSITVRTVQRKLTALKQQQTDH